MVEMGWRMNRDRHHRRRDDISCGLDDDPNCWVSSSCWIVWLKLVSYVGDCVMMKMMRMNRDRHLWVGRMMKEDVICVLGSVKISFSLMLYYLVGEAKSCCLAS